MSTAVPWPSSLRPSSHSDLERTRTLDELPSSPHKHSVQEWWPQTGITLKDKDNMASDVTNPASLVVTSYTGSEEKALLEIHLRLTL